MTPQEWIESTKRRWGDSGHLYEGAQHLAAALEEIARLQAQLAQAEAERVVCGYRFNTECLCAVPASRILKDGEVAVSRADLIEMVSNANACAYRPHSCEHSDIHAHSKAKARIADALRAQGKEGAT